MKKIEISNLIPGHKYAVINHDGDIQGEFTFKGVQGSCVIFHDDLYHKKDLWALDVLFNFYEVNCKESKGLKVNHCFIFIVIIIYLWVMYKAVTSGN